jgi:hypothetical protein
MYCLHGNFCMGTLWLLSWDMSACIYFYMIRKEIVATIWEEPNMIDDTA